MEPFLRQVASHYFSDTSKRLEDRCFIFPNRRAIAFFNKYLAEFAASGNVPVIAPACLTMSDFFAAGSGVQVADRISLLVDLYSCYSNLFPSAESLDDFIFWGDIILADFSDIDKYLAQASQIYTNIADLKAIADDFSYLSDRQREAIESFTRHFRGIGDRKKVKKDFVRIWNILLPLYNDFNKLLRSKSLAYEGMIYRSLAERVREESVSELLAKAIPEAKSFVFVGLNALNECEKRVMRKMRDAGISEFCWDFCSEMIKDPLNKSSHFMRGNILEFPQAFEPSGSGKNATFHILSVPSATGQVKQIPHILRKFGAAKPDDCAVILPDETLLTPLLSSIPPEIEDINITMGYPLSSGEFYALMRDITRLQIHARKSASSGIWSFYHKQVWSIFSSGLFRRFTEEDDSVSETIGNIKKGLKYYVDESEFHCPGTSESFAAKLLETIFRPVVTEPSAASAGQNRALADYLASIVTLLAPRLSKDVGMVLETDFAKEYYKNITSLRDKDLQITPQTFVRLFESLMNGVTVPFRGEPLKGLQVMGPLETRALDFRNVVILSCNEGTFPRKSVSSSFIPPELRAGFGLPTYVHQDCVWAYYFYRLMTRAENVWLVYDSRSEGVKSGEESRYIKLLRYHFKLPLIEHVASPSLGESSDSSDLIPKTQEDIAAIHGRNLSASSLQGYLDCPAKFYYHVVKGLNKDREVAESMDASMIGEVFHNTMMALFCSEEQMKCRDAFDKRESRRPEHLAKVDVGYLRGWLSRKDEIRDKISSLICAQVRDDEIRGRDLVSREVILKYVLKAIERDIELLEGSSSSHFNVSGVELPLNAEIDSLKFYGIIDRLDSLSCNGIPRVVDYKSGKDSCDILKIKPGKEDEAVWNIFDASVNIRHSNKAALQFYIYDRMLEQNGLAVREKLCNSMYSVSGLFSTPLEAVPVNVDFMERMDKRLSLLLEEITDPKVPFRKTTDKTVCRYCDFRIICGK